MSRYNAERREDRAGTAFVLGGGAPNMPLMAGPRSLSSTAASPSMWRNGAGGIESALDQAASNSSSSNSAVEGSSRSRCSTRSLTKRVRTTRSET